jgi:CheY-like chemotaxis protein
MSHELRTPLNGILGYAQLLRRDAALTERQRPAVEVIQQSGEQLLSLVNDVLDLARIEARLLELHPIEFSLPEFLRGIIDLVSVTARQKGLRFMVDCGPQLPGRIRADEQCLRRVLLNLLSNAVKFTDQGSVTLRVRFAPPDRVRFEVCDTGIGIPEQELERIFRPFEQLNHPTRRVGGTGLGLTICRTLVESMGGELTAESRPPERGTTFWFELHLPVVQPVNEAPVWVTAPAIGYGGPRRKILMVGDAPASRKLLVDWLRPLGFTTVESVCAARVGETALALRVDLILIDLNTPTTTGLEMIRSLRATPELGDVPVIVICASAANEELSNSLAAGATASLPKPIDFGRLQVLIGELLRIAWICGPMASARDEKTPLESLVVPPDPELDVLYSLAREGCMRDIAEQAANIASSDVRYGSFARELQRLARSYQSQAVLKLIESYRHPRE